MLYSSCLRLQNIHTYANMSLAPQDLKCRLTGVDGAQCSLKRGRVFRTVLFVRCSSLNNLLDRLSYFLEFVLLLVSMIVLWFSDIWTIFHRSFDLYLFVERFIFSITFYLGQKMNMSNRLNTTWCTMWVDINYLVCRGFILPIIPFSAHSLKN